MTIYYKGNTPMGHQPPPKRRPSCLYISHKSQLIKPRTNDDEAYLDSFYWCGIMKKRIMRRTCKDCKNYKALDNGHTGQSDS